MRCKEKVEGMSSGRAKAAAWWEKGRKNIDTGVKR